MRDVMSRFADSTRREGLGWGRPLWLFAIAIAIALILSPAVQASKSVVGYFAEVPGTNAGQLARSPDIAINNTGNGSGANAGDIYVSTSGEQSYEGAFVGRVQQFSSTGNFIREWGWDVVRNGQDDTGANEQQTVTVPTTATAGHFQLKVITATSLPYDAFFHGAQTGLVGSTVIPGVAASGAFRVGDFIAASNGGIPPGTTITAYDPTTNDLTLSQPVSSSLVFATFTAFEITTPIDFNAQAHTGTGSANVQASLEALPASGSGNVSVSGGPGASGTPFTVTFDGGLLAHDDIKPMIAQGTLTGGTVSVDTVANGGGFEICNVASSPTDACKNAVDPAAPGPVPAAAGSLSRFLSLAIDQTTGEIFVESNRRTNIYSSDGSFEGAFGKGVLTGGSSLEFCTTVCKEGSAGLGPNGEAFTGISAFDPSTGNLFIEGNGRIDEFSLTHAGSGVVTGATFVLAFGTDVVASGPDDTGTGFETCNVAAHPTDVCQAGVGGAAIGELNNIGSIAVDSHGVVYVREGEGSGKNVQAFTPSPAVPPYSSYTPAAFDPTDLNATSNSAPAQIKIGPGNHVFVTKTFPAGSSICSGGSASVAESHVLELDSLGVLQDTHMVCGEVVAGALAVNNATGALYLFGEIASKSQVPGTPGLRAIFGVDSSNPPSASLDTIVANTHGAAVTGTINPNGPAGGIPHSPTTSYHVEYKRNTESTWTLFGNPINIGFGVSDHNITVHLGGLQANTSYEARLIATKPGFPNGTSAPQVFQTLAVPPTIDALSSEGVTASSADLTASINPQGTDTTYHFEYGTTTEYGHQTPETDIGNSHNPQSIQDHIEGLEPVVYHFRAIAHNPLGTVTSADQTFTYFPPPCPNETLRQQNGSSYLPDCRAYELVSPPDAGTVTLVDLTIPAPYATEPARFGFGGAWGAVTGTNPTNNNVDAYVATRTTGGWVTTYPGIQGDEAVGAEFGAGDLAFEKFIFFNTNSAFAGTPQPPLHAPYLFDVSGDSLGRWPANVSSIPGGDSVEGAFQPSPDFSHMAFSSNNVDFDPQVQGLTTAPGSAYDYDTATGTTTLISKTANGADISQEPGNLLSPEEFIHFPGSSQFDPQLPALINPGVSTDGSHILMSTSQTRPPSIFSSGPAPSTRLYMSVDDVLHYDVSRGRDVQYAGMTADGSKVFFTSNENLTTDNSDSDTSTDLYMWSETTDSLTDISLGREGRGNTDECAASWTSGCDVKTVVGSGGGITDYPIATDAGDVYFYSPELLAGPEEGLEGAQNLYVYRNGEVHFVAALNIDGSAPLTRIQVSPDGKHTAFITKSRLTSYDNAGFAEMYSFDPATAEISCVSCMPSGAPPTSDVSGSTSGFFMSNDGRTFFSTDDAVVPQDTNDGADVYEFVEGRPQLITSGTAATHHNPEHRAVLQALSGVSADGVNVYFSTYDTLVSQDHNGAFLKFYDARTNGGFTPPLVSQPCAAADECHGAGNPSPSALAITSVGALGSGGNVSSSHRTRHRRRHHHKKKRHKHGRGRSLLHHVDTYHGRVK